MTAVSVSILNRISTAFSNDVVPRVPGTSIPSKMTKRAPVILLCRRRSLWGPGCVYVCVYVCVWVRKGGKGSGIFYRSRVPHRNRQTDMHTFSSTHGCLHVAIDLHTHTLYTHIHTHIYMYSRSRLPMVGSLKEKLHSLVTPPGLRMAFVTIFERFSIFYLLWCLCVCVCV